MSPMATRMSNRDAMHSNFISCRFHYFVLLILTFCSSGGGTPPEDPISCSSLNSNCTVTNSYGTFPDRSICRAGDVAYPSDEAELVATVAAATKAKRKMKVTTRFSHSIPKLVCPDGTDGLLISTKHLNRIVKVDKKAMRMTVESGVTLRQLMEEAAKAGLALPYSPYWWGLTVGGMLGTGAHGSSLWGKGSAVHDHVVEIRIVSPGNAGEGFVTVRTVAGKDSDDFNAVKVSLGVLGVISQVTFQLEPMFKRSLTYVTASDAELATAAVSFGRRHEFADFTWYPSQGKVVYRMDDRVPANTSGDGLYDFIGFRSTESLTLSLVRQTEETQEAVGDGVAKCASGKLTTTTLGTAAYGLTNDGLVFTGYPVIGFQNRLQSSGSCLDSPNDALLTACAWDPRIKSQFFHQSAFSIPLPAVNGFITDIQSLVKLRPESLCGLDSNNGILMRYVTVSSAFLGKDQDALDFDFTYYRSGDPLRPRLYEDVMEEIEQMALFKYGALPHWGKNRNVAFGGVIAKYKNSGAFLKAKQKLDPLGLFSSDWTDQVLGLKTGVAIDKEGCALEGLCVCSKDIHCAPSEAYLCRPGKVYKDARVCTRVITS